MLRFDDLPDLLKKLLVVWTQPENWGKKLKEVCQENGFNYGSCRTLIWEVGTLNFYELKAQLVDRAMLKLHDDVIKALAEKAKKGNARAIELYLKATRRLADRLEVQGSLDINLHQHLIEAKKKAEEVGE